VVFNKNSRAVLVNKVYLASQHDRLTKDDGSYFFQSGNMPFGDLRTIIVRVFIVLNPFLLDERENKCSMVGVLEDLNFCRGVQQMYELLELLFDYLNFLFGDTFLTLHRREILFDGQLHHR